jgi:spermidine synthase
MPPLLPLFVGSGCSALIYEIVWFQLLQLVIGSSAVSLCVLLGTFMGGLCLGSVAFPRLVSPRAHPLRVYALLELGIAVIGLAVFFGMPLADRLYVAGFGHGLPGFLLRGVVCALCLLPPTLLMGATLPAVGRWVEATPQGLSWLGAFYTGNIAGAVCGCLLAGFYLLRVHDGETATFVAAAVNVGVALLSLGLAALAPWEAPAVDPAPRPVVRVRGSWAVYIAIALSGACALSAEVIWTRLLSLMLGGTVYTFSLILAVFLAGLGLGSGIGSVLARETARPWALLAGCQLLLTAAVAWAAAMIALSLPYWPINPALSPSPWINFQLDVLRCLWAVLPAAVLWGASFPLALAAVAAPGQDPGRLVGEVYAANTVGAILGAAASSLLLIAWLGTQQAQRLLIAGSAAATLVLLVPRVWPFRAGTGAARVTGPLAVAGALGLAAVLAWGVAEVPWELIAYGRGVPTLTSGAKLLFMGEGMNSSVAVTQSGPRTRYFHVSGKVEASSEPWDMRMQRMLGHLPALVHRRPRSVLVVGCGAGVTAGCFVLHPGVERIVICELEPLVPQVVAGFFARENYDMLRDRRVEVVYDDARHFLLTTAESFDVITSDPIHPWVKGAATLYTQEYYELCKRHLNPGGVVTQWVPLYQSDTATVKSQVATFFEVFPGGTVWGNHYQGAGYDVVLLGQAEPTRINVTDLEWRLRRHDHARVSESLRDVGFEDVLDLLATYAGRGPDLRGWLKDAEVNHDRNLRLQYLAGLGLNLYASDMIAREMVTYRTFPDEILVISAHGKRELQRLWAGTSDKGNASVTLP